MKNDLGPEVARFRLNVWRSGSWTVPGALCVFGAVTGIAFADNGDVGWFLLLVGLSFAGAAWWVRVVKNTRRSFPLIIYSEGLIHDDGKAARVTRFADVDSMREETLAHGIGPWNTECALWVQMRNGDEIRIGNEVAEMAKASRLLRDGLDRSRSS